MQPTLSLADYEQRIRERAEQLWEEAGRPEGLSDHFWFAAERAFSADHPGETPPLAGQDTPLPHHDGIGLTDIA